MISKFRNQVVLKEYLLSVYTISHINVVLKAFLYSNIQLLNIWDDKIGLISLRLSMLVIFHLLLFYGHIYELCSQRSNLIPYMRVIPHGRQVSIPEYDITKVKAYFHYSLTLYHTIPTFNPFPNKPWFLRVCSTSIFKTRWEKKKLLEGKLLKTLWEKEKMLVTSIFSFSRNDFYSSQLKFQFLITFIFFVCKCFKFGLV